MPETLLLLTERDNPSLYPQATCTTALVRHLYYRGLITLQEAAIWRRATLVRDPGQVRLVLE